MARTMNDVPPERRAALSLGRAQTASLGDGFVIDFGMLFSAAIPEAAPEARARLDALKNSRYTDRMRLAAAVSLETLGQTGYERLAAHPSDTVRGWAAYLLGMLDLPLADKLRRVRPLAGDPHFGVREWAWLGLRDGIVADVKTAIRELLPWTAEASVGLRRFASESTRPRGVWSKVIPDLVADPGLALPILEALKADPEKYVQDSVGNWLNDAGKSAPEFVWEICGRWSTSGDPATAKIVKRALRNIKK